MQPKIIAHRGHAARYSENTIPAFLAAIDARADGIEFDVRLTSDGIPVVFHYFSVDGVTTGTGPVHAHTLESLSRLEAVGTRQGESAPIPTLREVLEVVAGKIELEIELKGPEIESVSALLEVLTDVRSIWPTIEVTSYEPTLLAAVKEATSIRACLLMPRSESWMTSDYFAYVGYHRARLAQADAVHLHPSQLSTSVVQQIRLGGIAVHAWDVNDRPAYETIVSHEISRCTTDRLVDALRWRSEGSLPPVSR